MGKSIDLPDPLEAAGSSQPLGNADDLLAQLAGEEVDRLLAESEGGNPSAESAEASAGAPAAPAPEAAIRDQLDALFTEIDSEKSPPAPAEAAPTGVPAPAGEAPQLPAVAPIRAADDDDDVLAPAPTARKLPDDIDTNAVMAAILGEPGQMGKLPDFAPAAPAAPIAAAAAPAKPIESETTTAERQGLADTNPADELPGPGELRALTAPVEADEVPLPLYLKPLEWLNAPLNWLPPAVRDAMGQIAILTLINAIAVLIYVYFFRKP